MTNYKKVKNLCLDEMTEKLDEMVVCNCCPIREFCDKNKETHYGCKRIWMKWLKSEAENNG